MDDTAVRVMVTRGKRIAKLAELPLESGLGSIDTPEKEAELGRKIEQLLKFNKIRQGKVILGLSGLHCLTRPAVLPELPKAMLGEAVIREAKRILPVPLEQLHLSWQVISVSGGKTQVFLVGLPRQIADMAVRVVNKAGCKPHLMDIKPLALARLSREATAIILDVQPKEFDIVMMVAGIPQPIRTIAFPQAALPLQEKFDIVKQDFKRTLEFLKSKVDESQIKPESVIYVSGELAEHPELYEPLALECGLKAAKLTSPLKYLKYLEPAQYLVNAGLVLKEMTKEAGPLLPNFNTLPEPYQPKHISMNRLLALPAGMAGIGVLVLLFMTVQNGASAINQAQGQLDNTNYLLTKKQAQKKEMIDNINTLQQQINDTNALYDTYNAALKLLTANGSTLNHDLNAAVDNIGQGLTVVALSLNSGSISLAGTADSEEAVFSYVRNLTNTGRFKEITIGGITVNQSDADSGESSVSYSLSCVLKADRK